MSLWINGSPPGIDTTGAPHFVGCVQALLDAQAAIQDRGRVIDLAAPGARQIAAEQRLQHQHQGYLSRPSSRCLST